MMEFDCSHGVDTDTQPHLGLDLSPTAPFDPDAAARKVPAPSRRRTLKLALQRMCNCAKLGPMEPLALAIRRARPDDAASIARVYIDSWHDTYAGFLSKSLLCAMTEKGPGMAKWSRSLKAHVAHRKEDFGCE